jgi:hypothetical protein
VNGKTYASLEEMPPDVRRGFEEAMRKFTTDADGNGIPDIFENASSDDPDQKNVVITKSVVVDSRQIDQIDDLPAELRNALSDSFRPTRRYPRVYWVYFVAAIIAIGIVVTFAYRLISSEL